MRTFGHRNGDWTMTANAGMGKNSLAIKNGAA
jgi:hypothetical protein